MQDRKDRRIAGLLAASALAGPAMGALARAVSPRPGRSRRFGGRRVEVLDRGDGPPLLLIHGLFGNMLNFHRLLPLLHGFRVLAYDRRGAGRSDSAGPGGASLPAQAALAAEVLEAAGGHPAIVVGHSLGGAVALQLAADRPDLVAGVVTAGGLTRTIDPRVVTPPAALGRTPPLREVVARGATLPVMSLVTPVIGWMSFAPEVMPADFPIQGGGMMAGQPRALSGALRDLDVVERGVDALQPRLPELRMPLTILQGAEDHVVRPDQARRLKAKLPHARLRMVPGAGHMLPVTHPALVARLIREVSGGG